MKRLVDIAAAAVGLFTLWPLLFALAALVRLGSPGPAIFAQTRVGRGGRPFRLLKLRSMHVGTSDKPTHQASAADVTALGRHLRRWKLDELPQLWNVLSGEMSLVGPRPCLTTQAELIEERRRRGVFVCRPGITGLAQVVGCDMSEPRRLARIDALYARRRSLRLDLLILWTTLWRRGPLSRRAERRRRARVVADRL